MKTTDEQREKIILGIADMLRNHGFTFEFKVMKKPRGIRIIHEVTQIIMAITIDVMKGQSFCKTLSYAYNPLFKFDNIEFGKCIQWVQEELPFIKDREDITLFLRFPSGEEYKCKILK